MNSEDVDVIASKRGSPAGGEAVADDSGGSQAFLWLHLHLRGRYWLAALLSLILAGGLGYLGFRLGYQTYRSTGLMQVLKPQTILWKMEDEAGNDLDGFAAAHATLLHSQRVVEMAMLDPAWQELKRPASDSPVDDFMQSLKVVSVGRMIQLTFDDRDPRAAALGVKTVIAAHHQLYIERDAQEGRRRFEVLQNRETSLNNEAGALKAQIDAIEKIYGTDDLSGICTNRRQALERSQDVLQEMNIRLAGAPTAPGAKVADDGGEWAALLARLEVEQLAQQDQALRDLLSERTTRERELRTYKEVQGYGDDHPTVVRTQRALVSAGHAVDERAQKVRENLKRGKPANVATPGLDLAELRQRAAELKKMCDVASLAVVALGQENLRLRAMQQERDALRKKADEFRRRIDQLNLEVVGSRVEVLGEGVVPSSSQTDTRIRFAAAGGFLGVIAAFGIALVPSLVGRRYRAADETRLGGQSAPVLGVLPELPSDVADDQNMALAAHCVHQTRTLIQMRHLGARGQVLAITSSLSGTGKTSLAMALGVSFATSGSRTLLIDCDLVGGGLSARVSKMRRRRLGRLLTREGLVTDEQLSSALAHAKVGGRRLGEVCVELGYVETGDLEATLKTQEDEHVGLLEALAGEELLECAAETGFPGLSVMSLGKANARHCASLSPQALRRLIERARDEYDTILIDTGPIPGSLEASIVVPQVDGVVLVVSRGEPRAAVNRTTAYLREIGASPIGVVFNRATSTDIMRSSSHFPRSSSYAGTSSGIGLSVDRSLSERTERMGPVARAVAGCAPRGEGEAE